MPEVTVRLINPAQPETVSPDHDVWILHLDLGAEPVYELVEVDPGLDPDEMFDAFADHALEQGLLHPDEVEALKDPDRYKMTWDYAGPYCFASVASESPDPRELQKSLDLINDHRRKIGQQPLEPARAGWSDQDIVREAARIHARQKG